MSHRLFWFAFFCWVCINTGNAEESVPRTEPRVVDLPSSKGINPKIVGGTAVDPSEYPWIVSFRFHDSNFGYITNHFCGGSVFDVSTRTWILTAANCLDNTKATIAWLNSTYAGSDFRLYADIGRFDKNDWCKSCYLHAEIDGWQMHEAYNSESLENNVAVAWSFENVTVEPITLQPSAPCCVENDLLRAIGYGKDIDGDFTDMLEYVDVAYMTTESCEELLDESNGDADYVLSGMLCAYGAGQGPCVGDSGAPLILGTDKRSAQVAIFYGFYGDQCAKVGFPDIYGDVGFYYEWIMSVCECETDTTTSTVEAVSSTLEIMSMSTTTTQVPTETTEVVSFSTSTTETVTSTTLQSTFTTVTNTPMTTETPTTTTLLNASGISQSTEGLPTLGRLSGPSQMAFVPTDEVLFVIGAIGVMSCVFSAVWVMATPSATFDPFATLSTATHSSNSNCCC